MTMNSKNSSLKIGFVSTRFAGTDGVSLEAEKWAAVFMRMGHTCFYFAGLCDRPAEVSYVVPNMFFHHPEMEAIHEEAFNQTIRSLQFLTDRSPDQHEDRHQRACKFSYHPT